MATAMCIFCKIIKGEIPSVKLVDTTTTLAFMDISPLSQGHCLVIPKEHTAKMHELADESLRDILPIAKKIVNALGASNYNILQNNGRLAHQEVEHVHFHIIPKPNESEGLGIGWPMTKGDMGKINEIADTIRGKL